VVLAVVVSSVDAVVVDPVVVDAVPVGAAVVDCVGGAGRVDASVVVGTVVGGTVDVVEVEG
jgi:hypothetical protein